MFKKNLSKILTDLKNSQINKFINGWFCFWKIFRFYVSYSNEKHKGTQNHFKRILTYYKGLYSYFLSQIVYSTLKKIYFDHTNYFRPCRMPFQKKTVITIFLYLTNN